MNKVTNIALVLEYDGSNFLGFQRQKSGIRTIQNELELALSKFANHNINIVSAGRTDTGVHAKYQVINFRTQASRKLYGWVCGINALLPPDIRIHEAVLVPDEFDARFSAVSRTYKYYLLQDRVGSAIFSKKVGTYYTRLDIEIMAQAGDLLLGVHDFSSFRASNCQARTALRDMLHFDIKAKDNLLCFEFKANAFLYHMIRNIVGALVYVGAHKISLEDFKKLFYACDRTKAPPTFMPDGLYLSHVEYNSDYFNYASHGLFTTI